jgi:hypothetical protein
VKDLRNRVPQESGGGGLEEGDWRHWGGAVVVVDLEKQGGAMLVVGGLEK